MTTSEHSTAPSTGARESQNSELQARKVQAEIAKLEAETRSLRKPLSQLSAWIPMAVGIVGILTAVGQWQRAELEAQRSLLKIEQERIHAQDQIQQVKGELARYQRDFLERVVHNLNLTRDAAARYYASTDEWQDVVQLRASNLEIESLLNTMSKTQILPPSLAPDLERLRTHYAEWHAAFNSAFPNGHAAPHTTKVEVGTFPDESDARVRACLESLLKGGTCG
jgi:hypothetical protein